MTGGAGFIGSAVCRQLVDECGAFVINVDKLTYAANLHSLELIAGNPRYVFERADICHRASLEALFSQYQPTGVIHLAAESHVDRSISGAEAFLRTNVEGTFHLLEAATRFYSGLNSKTKSHNFCLVHVSTDEVYGSLGALWLVSRRIALPAKLTLLRYQSRVGSFGSRLAQDLRVAGRHFELL